MAEFKLWVKQERANEAFYWIKVILAVILFLGLTAYFTSPNAYDETQSKKLLDRIHNVYAPACIKEGHDKGEDHIKCIEQKIDDDFNYIYFVRRIAKRYHA